MRCRRRASIRHRHRAGPGHRHQRHVAVSRLVAKRDQAAIDRSMVEVRLGDVTTTTATDVAFVDRERNTRLAKFQRFVAATWDGCALAVANVNLATARAMS